MEMTEGQNNLEFNRTSEKLKKEAQAQGNYFYSSLGFFRLHHPSLLGNRWCRPRQRNHLMQDIELDQKGHRWTK